MHREHQYARRFDLSGVQLGGFFRQFRLADTVVDMLRLPKAEQAPILICLLFRNLGASCQTIGHDGFESYRHQESDGQPR